MASPLAGDNRGDKGGDTEECVGDRGTDIESGDVVVSIAVVEVESLTDAVTLETSDEVAVTAASVPSAPLEEESD
jgi:hypothetical protein